MLKLENIVVNKDSNSIFNNLNIEFKLGESYAIVGKSGSGKSTLLNIIAGFEKVQSGKIMFKSKPIKFNRSFYKDNLGYVFQNYGLIDNKSVGDNLDIGLKFKSMSKVKKEELKSSYINDFNLNINKNRKISSLSGGEQQRVALIRLILKKPNIILADEPTGALDEKSGNFIFSVLLSLVNKETILIMATHDMSLARQCDNIIDISKDHSSQI